MEGGNTVNQQPQSPPHPQPTIFVSHSSKDNEFGVKLVQDLRRVVGNDDAVWYDVSGGLNGGDSWWSKIVGEVTAREIFLLILSSDAMNSDWVLRELDIALNERKKIVPLLLRGCKVRADLKIIQTISFLPPKTYEAAFNELLIALRLSADGKPREQPSSPSVNQPFLTSQETPLANSRDTSRAPTHSPPATMTPPTSREQDIPASSLEQFKGQGQQVSPKFRLQNGLVIFRMTHDGRRLFRIWLLDDKGSHVALLASTVGSFNGSKAVGIKQAGTYILNIDADGNWTVQVEEQKRDQNDPQNNLQRYLVDLATCERAILLNPSNAEAYNKKGLTLYNLKRYPEALAACEQAIQLDPNLAVAYSNKGLVLYYLKQYPEALAACEQAIQLDPNLAVAYSNKGIVLRAFNRNSEALVAYEQAIRLNPRNAVFYLNKGMALTNLKRYPEALAACEQAIQLNPNLALAYNFKGLALHNLKRPLEALAACEQAIQLDPNLAVAYNNKGLALLELKRYPEALAACEQAIHLDPNLVFAYNNKGNALYYLKRYAEAVAAYEKAVSIDPNLATIYGGMGQALEQLGRLKEAQQVYEKVRQLATANKKVL
jgi:tetratricopeptide (TPR) repeat protein